MKYHVYDYSDPYPPDEERPRRRRRRQRRKRRKHRGFLLLVCCIIAIGVYTASLRTDLLSGFLPAAPLPSTTSGVGGHGGGNDDSDPALSLHSADSETVRSLKAMSEGNPQVKKILQDLDSYPEELLTLALKNSEAAGFVADYPEKHMATPEIDLSAEASQDTVPLLLQWDERWGYQSYGSGLIGWTGCGPTCMSMITLYLTGDASYDPGTVAAWAEENGYYSSGNGTAWTFMSKGCRHFGLRAEELPLVRQYMTNALDEDCPIVCAMAPGDFTTTGHYIVITGYDGDGFTVNDPNSPERSSRHWTYDELEGQISNLWAFSKA